MSFAKLLCIFTTTLGLHIASTSPNPPLKPSERKMAPTRVEFILVSGSLREVQKVFYWCAAIAETIMTVARFNPRSLPAQAIISTLALGGNLPTTRLTPSIFVGSLLVTCGALLRLQCYRALGEHFTFEMGITRNHRLITTGPYNYIRHPSYSGAILVYLGLLLYYAGPGSWFKECMFKGSMVGAIFCAIYILGMSLVVTGLIARISKEDEGLRRQFGREWTDWVARVPCVLIPGVY
ncbi:hypothetical protein B0H16DRAFT_1324281 [Mycena metata]|uniref:Protein-S-isoprenylcysteine O-methyltransferase n=1 Tax=Mycena metata TaxID=1033252 RepID=A0AAD7IDE4_9AGAR|nr:hypothetical protein B0H16DRAFT_1324281 [Mycena metata]